jgi:hypothetical protein
METIIEIITPEKAEEYLFFNSGNRALRKSHIVKLASEMKQGNWQCTHQGIAFNDKGVLIDGQHRLHAVKMSGVCVKMQVTRGVNTPDHLSLKIDLSARRSTGDLLKMPTKVASVITVLARMMNGWGSVPISYVEECSKVFRSDAESICAISSSHMALIDSAPVKAAAVAMSTLSKSYYANAVMARLNGQMYDQMTPIEHAYCKICAMRTYDKNDPYNTFAKALSVFDERNAAATKVYLSEFRYAEAKDAVIARMKEHQNNGN